MPSGTVSRCGRLAVLALGAVLACCGVAAAHKLTTEDNADDSGSKFDIETFVTTHSKQSFTFKVTLAEDVVDADFTNTDASTPEEEHGPSTFEDTEGNRVCVDIERRISANAFPKYLAACTETTTDGTLTAKVYRLDFGLKGRGKSVRASLSGRTVTLVVQKSKLPRAKETRVAVLTRYFGGICANPCWDNTANRPQRRHKGG